MRSQDEMLENWNFYNDPRTINALTDPTFDRIDFPRMKGIIIVETEVDEETFLQSLPEHVAKFLKKERQATSFKEILSIQQEFLDTYGESLDYPDNFIAKEIEVPLKFEVCSQCQGKGEMVDQNIDCQGITQEDFDRDPYFKEQYLNGEFNVTCSLCNGDRVTPVWDQKNTSKEIRSIIKQREQENRDYAHECAMEAARGC